MFFVSIGFVLWLLGAVQGSGLELLGEPFDNERLHLRFRPPAGWHMVHGGLSGDDPIEFWKNDEYGPRIQINAFPYELSTSSDVDKARGELFRNLSRQFPDLEVIHEAKLVYRGIPAIEVTAKLDTDNDTFRVLQRCLFARGRIYVITCATFESSFLVELPTFVLSLESVEILDDETGPLIRPATFAVGLVGFLASGLILRRASLTRLKEMQH